MTAYTEKSTAELIEMLLREEDRVTLAHIEELVARADSTAPLRKILADDYYWFEAEGGEWWSVYHAVTILALKAVPETLPEMLQALTKAYDADFDWLHEVMSAALARFGPAAIEPLLKYQAERRRHFLKDQNVTYERSRAIETLTRIALEHPSYREQILESLCSLVTDPTEKDDVFLGLIVDYPVRIDRERGLKAAAEAFSRHAIDETICGNYDALVRDSEDGEFVADLSLTKDLREFYEPEKIAARQRRWKNEHEAELKRFITGTPSPSRLTSGEAREILPLIQQLAEISSQRKKPAPVAQASLSDEIDLIAADEYEDPGKVPPGYIEDSHGSLLRAEKIGRNDPCPCRSGKKYKKCCGS